MTEKDDIICIIPARGGSKRVPGKNVRSFAGLPLIAHPIRAALKSGCFARVVVSTDDETIATVAREHGAETPFMREAKLADDFTGTAEVIVDAIERLGAQDSPCICCLYPTAPFVRPDDLRQSLARFRASGAYSMNSTTDFDFPPLRGFKLFDGDRIAFNWPEFELTRSQDLPAMVHDAGAFYWLDTARFLKRQRLVGDGSICWQMERWRAVDIDTEEDFRFAEFLMRYQAEAEKDAG